MVKVTFISSNGQDKSIVEGKAGDNLLDLAQADDQPLEGICEGQMACSTCHVIVHPEDFAQLKAAEEMEEDMLDLAACITPTSRLACQITLDDKMEQLRVKIPAESINMQER